MCDSKVLSRVVRAIDPIADVGGRRQRLEPMEKAGRNVEVSKVLVVEHERRLCAESGRIRSNVHENIEHGAIRTSDELCLADSRAAMHSANRALARSGLRILDKTRRCASLADIGIEEICVKGPSEEATIIMERLWGEDQHVGQFGYVDLHLRIVPSSEGT